MSSNIQIHSYSTEMELAQAAASNFQKYAEQCINEAGSFKFALSGGGTPILMLQCLSKLEIQWNACELFQVDERISPLGDDSRNLTHIRENLIDVISIPEASIHPMPVEQDDLGAAAESHSDELVAVCGKPPVLDLAVLGLGMDGHTASLIPDDPILFDEQTYTHVTRKYNGFQRMTLTYPILNRARRVLWLVKGDKKAEVLNQFLSCDSSLPATKVNRENAILFADEEALSIYNSQS